MYEDPWLAGGHNGLSNLEDPKVPQDPYKEGIELEEGRNYNEAFITSNGMPIALAKLEGKYIIPFRVFNN